LTTFSPAYSSPRIQTSSSTARLPQAHTPQADAQRSGEEINVLNRLMTILVLSFGSLASFYSGVLYDKTGENVSKMFAGENGKNCAQALALAKEYVQQVDPNLFEKQAESIRIASQKEFEQRSNTMQGFKKDHCTPKSPK
jgi:hypothetical protein